MSTISRTELARNTREIVEQVRRGQPVIVRSYGEDQVVLLDALDYRLMRALVNYALGRISAEGEDDKTDAVVCAYLDEHISLAKAAERLGLSRFELMERFDRLGLPLRVGPATPDETREEVRVARHGRSSAP